MGTPPDPETATPPSTSPGEVLRHLPKVDKLLDDPRFTPLIDEFSRLPVVAQIRTTLDALRARGAKGALDRSEITPEAIENTVRAALVADAIPFYRPVINATGVVLHTGLGRSPIAPEVADLLGERVRHPLRVEIDPETGQRGGRDEGCAALIRELTGAEAATVVNNNAGATLLLLSALAGGKKVLCSRGEMVEIGGSFRVPDIMELGGAQLVDVGTTNRTHPKDYENRANDEGVAMILKVHTSNYRVVGFTEEVEIDTLCEIGKKSGKLVVHDLGSGCLIDLAARGRPGESRVAESIEAGADLVCFSGDKLLGGPQSGIIAGKKAAVDACRKHPLFRAMRPCRLTYVALEATLRIYKAGPDEAIERIPALGRLLASAESLDPRAEALRAALAPIDGLTAHVEPHGALAGSGSLPAREFESRAVRLETDRFSATDLATRLRAGARPIFPTVRDDGVRLDVRTIDDEDVAVIATKLTEIFAGS